MTQGDKNLLLKDLCARLPYGIKCYGLHSPSSTLTRIDVEDSTVYYADCDEWESIEDCKPYLRPMASMTEEEENKYRAINCYEGLFPRNEEAFDYVLAHHFDYRGLIEKGLALEAPIDMYKN